MSSANLPEEWFARVLIEFGASKYGPSEVVDFFPKLHELLPEACGIAQARNFMRAR